MSVKTYSLCIVELPMISTFPSRVLTTSYRKQSLGFDLDLGRKVPFDFLHPWTNNDLKIYLRAF